VSAYRAWPFLSDPAHPYLSAVWALLAHGCIAVFAVAPILRRSRHPLPYAALAFVGGSLLDVDHLIAAGSLNLHRIETLGGRPDTHSLVFVALLSVLVLALWRNPRVAWAVFAVNASHLLFDAAGGNDPILYPISRLDSLPWLACPIGTLLLFAASVWIVRRTRDPVRARPSDERVHTIADLG
jgi:membrane-bound metal-dependent hydrolase YbcI (DUF457 family)